MSQFARVAWVIVAGFVVLELIVHLVFVHDQMLAGTRAYALSVIDRTLALHALLDGEADVADRRRLIAASSGVDFGAELRETAPQSSRRDWPHRKEIAADIAQHLAAIGAPEVGVDISFGRGERRFAEPVMHVTVPQSEGGYLVVTAAGFGFAARSRPAVGGVIATLLVVGAVLWAARRSTRHLSQFAAAAEALGRNVSAPALVEAGPREVRRAATAFNDMARRVRAHLEERTQLLAAVSHDARTLLTKLDLRLEHIADTAHRGRARDDVAQMTALFDSVLAFAREDEADEAYVRIDLASLLVTLVDDEVTLGRTAAYRGPDRFVMEGRPFALRRAFTNLIDNALRYGGSADVELSTVSGRVRVDVADRGPGIPLEHRQRVLQPFERLEQSRNRATGGTGLGLTIAYTVITRHGGVLELLDRPGGGLIVRVELPALA